MSSSVINQTPDAFNQFNIMNDKMQKIFMWVDITFIVIRMFERLTFVSRLRPKYADVGKADLFDQ